MEPTELTREMRSEYLSRADPAAVIELADRIVDRDDVTVTVTRTPTVGSVAAQVREPIGAQRFLLTDVVTSSAEVLLCGVPGWGMRLGSDRHAALAQAVLDAEAAAQGPLTDAIDDLARRTKLSLQGERTAHWQQLKRTIVEFEEIP